MTSYTKRGPFVDASPTGPYVDAGFFNNLEAALIAATNTTLIAPAPSGDTTGSTDQAALQPLLTQAQSTTGGTLVLQAGTYYVTGLTTAQSFNQPRILGQGMKYTTLSIVGSGIGITMVGGSGQASGGEIADLTVTGAAATGIELAGPIGVHVRRVRFVTLTTGLRFHNRDSGSFTEFCVAEDCFFEATVTTQIEYKRTNGNDSFHGTGFRNCVGNQASTDIAAKIVIGAGCKVYDAPFDGDFFLFAAGVTYVSSVSTSMFITHGNLRFEASANTGRRWMTTTGSTWYHAGHVTYLTDGILLGGFLAEQVQGNSDGSMTVQYKPFERYVPVGTGTTTIASAVGAQGSSWIAGISVTGSNYEYNYLLHLYRFQAANGGVVTQLANPRSFNSAGYGAPTFAIDSTTNRLTVTNAAYPATGLNASVALQPLNLANSSFRFAT